MALDETILFPCADEKEEEQQRRYETKQQSSEGSRCLCILIIKTQFHVESPAVDFTCHLIPPHIERGQRQKSNAQRVVNNTKPRIYKNIIRLARNEGFQCA
jgi:hypothetical protein